jgi:hypothetical protein
MDTDYYTASPGPSPPPPPSPTSHYNIRSHTSFPRRRPSVTANWPPEVLEIMNRNVLSSNRTRPGSPNTRFSPITRSPAPGSPLNPASNPIESITDIMEITSVNSPLPLRTINTPGSHSRHSSIGQSAIPPHVLEQFQNKPPIHPNEVTTAWRVLGEAEQYIEDILAGYIQVADWGEALRIARIRATNCLRVYTDTNTRFQIHIARVIAMPGRSLQWPRSNNPFPPQNPL